MGPGLRRDDAERFCGDDGRENAVIAAYAGMPVLDEIAWKLDSLVSCRSVGRDKDRPICRSITLACRALCSSSQRPNAAGDSAGA
jgi:hypothetical protein